MANSSSPSASPACRARRGRSSAVTRAPATVALATVSLMARSIRRRGSSFAGRCRSRRPRRGGARSATTRSSRMRASPAAGRVACRTAASAGSAGRRRAPTLADQVAAAFSADHGHVDGAACPIPIGDCTPAETACRRRPPARRTARPEIAAPIVAAIAAYVASLPTPLPAEDAAGSGRLRRARGAPPATARASSTGAGRSATLYSDLCCTRWVPDLDDGVAEPGARASEWRTPPLLGLGAQAAARYRLAARWRALRRSSRRSPRMAATPPRSRATASTVAMPAERAALISYLEGL